jgi:DNA-directed RNA polymerase subunit RPC12/RpoP
MYDYYCCSCGTYFRHDWGGHIIECPYCGGDAREEEEE